MIDKKVKVPVREQEPKVRAGNFKEVCYGYDTNEAMLEATRCLNCKNPRCVQACPVGVNIPSFIAKVKDGDIEAAAQIIAQNSSLPAVCGRVCPQESQCEGSCVVGIKNEAVSIGKLERFVADWARERDLNVSKKDPSNGIKVAVIGSGPSGLACAGDLAKKGYKEITLLGQNVNSYGKTLRPKVTFPELLKMVNEIDGIERIRFLTSHPKDCSDELIDAMASLDKVCENIHLPFQSGSNKILKDMHRVYTREHYLELIRKLKEKVPNITLSTDIIVGFPGETEEDFEDTLSMVEKVGYDQGFTFLYSIRKGTKAAEMQNQIPHEVKQERFQRLIDSMYKIFYEKNKECLGQTLEVLVEGISKNNPDILTGRTRGYKLVHFKGGKRNIGQLVNVKITGHNSFALEGEIV